MVHYQAAEEPHGYGAYDSILHAGLAKTGFLRHVYRDIEHHHQRDLRNEHAATATLRYGTVYHDAPTREGTRGCK